MSIDILLAILGILIAVIFGVWGAKKVWKNRQSQSVKNSSIGIQAGRDVKINRRDD